MKKILLTVLFVLLLSGISFGSTSSALSDDIFKDNNFLDDVLVTANYSYGCDKSDSYLDATSISTLKFIYTNSKVANPFIELGLHKYSSKQNIFVKSGKKFVSLETEIETESSLIYSFGLEKVLYKNSSDVKVFTIAKYSYCGSDVKSLKIDGIDLLSSSKNKVNFNYIDIELCVGLPLFTMKDAEIFLYGGVAYKHSDYDAEYNISGEIISEKDNKDDIAPIIGISYKINNNLFIDGKAEYNRKNIIGSIGLTAKF